MHPNYIAALNGTLTSTPDKGEATDTAEILNNLICSVAVYFVTSSGWHQYIGVIKPGQKSQLSRVQNGQKYIIKMPQSGAFVCTIEITSSKWSYIIHETMFTPPNDIGPHPEPNKKIIIPPNSPLVLVAVGTIPHSMPGDPISGKKIVTREQYWMLQGDSYSIIPKETRTISYTITSGKQNTSSEQKTISASLGLSTSGGWGPVSASLSASLNTSSTSFQQVTVSEQTSVYVSDQITNDTEKPLLVLRWQMIDVLTVFDKNGNPEAVVSSGGVVLARNYDPSNLPDPPSVTLEPVSSPSSMPSLSKSVPIKR